MKLTVLVDNHTFIDRYFIGEPAVSYFIEVDGKRILFDTGYSDAFMKNAMKMKIDLLDLDYVLLSHGHSDHTWGLDVLIRAMAEAKFEGQKINKPSLVAHPDIFKSKLLDEVGEIGSLLTEGKLSKHFTVTYSKEPYYISDNFIFLGEIERTTSFEAKIPIGKKEEQGKLVDDFLLDDSALVYKSCEGLIIITGCSHAGICNIIEYAKKVTGEERIVDVIGGFHLQHPSKEQLEGTISYFEQLKVKDIHACHCTDLASKISLSKVVNVKEVGVGLQLEYN